MHSVLLSAKPEDVKVSFSSTFLQLHLSCPVVGLLQSR